MLHPLMPNPLCARNHCCSEEFFIQVCRIDQIAHIWHLSCTSAAFLLESMPRRIALVAAVILFDWKFWRALCRCRPVRIAAIFGNGAFEAPVNCCIASCAAVLPPRGRTCSSSFDRPLLRRQETLIIMTPHRDRTVLKNFHFVCMDDRTPIHGSERPLRPCAWFVLSREILYNAMPTSELGEMNAFFFVVEALLWHSTGALHVYSLTRYLCFSMCLCPTV
jgi:hypothetical protein